MQTTDNTAPSITMAAPSFDADDKSVLVNIRGRQLWLRANLNTAVALAEAFDGADIVTVFKQMKDGISWGRLRKLLWCLMSDNDPAPTEAEVGRLIDMRDLPPVMAAMKQLIGGKPAWPGELAPFVPTPKDLVQAMLIDASGTDPIDDANAQKWPLRGLVVIDMGAGDGRVLARAIALGAEQAIGYEHDHAKATAIRTKYPLAHVIEADVRTADLSRADIVFLYLLPESNEELKAVLVERCKPGAVIVSHAFDMVDWPKRSTGVLKCADGQERTWFTWAIDDVRRMVDVENQD